MVKRSKLLAALDAHKGKDYKLEKQKKLQKLAIKGKQSKSRLKDAEADDEETRSTSQLKAGSDGWDSDESEEAGGPKAVNIMSINDSESDSDSGLENQELNPNSIPSINGGKVDEEDPEAILLSDIEDLSDEERTDIIPYQRLTINNTSALIKAQKSIALPIIIASGGGGGSFSDHQTIASTELIPIPDVNDDLQRELAFYKQCLDAVDAARILLKKEGVAVSRPTDYFAEMVKSDEHMGKIKQKMVDEAAGKRAAAEARKQRDLKKFGKQVQIAKLQERDKTKRDTLDKVNLLKRKRRNTDATTAQEEELFDVALEDAGEASKSARVARNNGAGGQASSDKRHKKNDKYGFGGKKRFSKSGDAASSADLRGFSSKKMKGQRKGAQRPGKSRRAKQL